MTRASATGTQAEIITGHTRYFEQNTSSLHLWGHEEGAEINRPTPVIKRLEPQV